ncbi:MAG TPA: flagellar basal-body MS-ring/collar protein FliF [bacterium]|nr:flagellar basal-body MS-ring/collar protein FliF [bacterium]
MNDFFRQLSDQTRSAWQRFNPMQRLVVVAVPLLLLLGIGYLLYNGAQPRYRTLYANLSARDAGVLAQKLKADNVEYRVGADGTSLEVPEEQLYDERLNLASQNLPLGGGVGFEVFDKNNFGVTDFTQQVDYQRALEGELSRTISHLSEVSEARVHLVLPKPELYSAREKDATASVVVDLRDDAQLSTEQIRGIVMLVSASVEGLDPKNVTLLDSHGDVLSDAIRDDLADEAADSQPAGADGAVTGGRLLKQTNGQLEVQERFEHDLEQRVAGMLDRVLGPNRAAVRVTAELNFDQSEENSETYEPVANNEGLPRSTERNVESYTGTGTLPGGVPGTESNIPGYQAQYATASNSSYTKSEDLVNYEMNKKVAKVVEAPGSVKRLSIAVMVDSLQPQQVDSIRQAVIAAAGLDTARGDQVAVENVSFDTSDRHASELADLQSQRTELWLILWKGIVVLLIVVFLLFFLNSILKPRVVRVQERLIREITRVGETEAGVGEEAAIPLDQVGRPSESALEEQRKAQLRQQVIRLAREKPQTIAMLIRRWLSEEKA